MTRPEWTGGEPIGVYRAPWYNNWPAALTLSLTLAILVPIPALMNGYGAVGSVWLGVQAGVSVGVGAFIVFSGLTYLYPVRLYPEGIRGFEERGRPVIVEWLDVGRSSDDQSYGVPFVRFAVTGAGHDLWLPQAILDREDFAWQVRSLLPQDHPLVGVIGPADRTTGTSTAGSDARSEIESTTADAPPRSRAAAAVAPPRVGAFIGTAASRRTEPVAAQAQARVDELAGSGALRRNERSAAVASSRIDPLVRAPSTSTSSDAALPSVNGRRALAYVCGVSIMAAAAVVVMTLGQKRSGDR